jgi:hypothetical protein
MSGALGCARGVRAAAESLEPAGDAETTAGAAGAAGSGGASLGGTGGAPGTSVSKGVGASATTGSGGAGGDACMPGAACTPAEACKLGEIVCEPTESAGCVPTGDLPAGTACAAGACDGAGRCLSFAGAFELSDPTCAPCANPNPFTAACSCPTGFVSDGLRVLNDCAGIHGAFAHVCRAPILGAAAEYAGIYQIDDAVACGQGCRAPNPATGTCACPLDATAVAMRAVSDTPCKSLIGTTIVFCWRPSAAPKSFGGAYQLDDAVPGAAGCRAPNPATGGCSCPSAHAPHPLRAIVDLATGLAGSTLVACAPSAPPPSVP